MNEKDKEFGEELVRAVHREAAERYWGQPWPPAERPTLHYTELPEDKDDPAWSTYRREVGRLLAEGHEGKWVLIKGEEIIGLWSTGEEAKEVALQKFLLQPVLIHQIRTREPILRVSSRFYLCPS